MVMVTMIIFPTSDTLKKSTVYATFMFILIVQCSNMHSKLTNPSKSCRYKAVLLWCSAIREYVPPIPYNLEVAVRGGGRGRALKVCLLPFVGGIKRGGVFFRGGSEGPICALGNTHSDPISLS